MELAIEAARGAAASSLSRRLHSASGLFPLGAYLFFHAWEHWPVRAGRDALFARLEHSSHVLPETLLVLLPLLMHALLGVRLAREPDPGASYAGPAYRRLQALTGALAAAFLLYHLSVSWWPRLVDPNPIGAAFGATAAGAGTLTGLSLHAVGIAAVCAHFGQGLGAALVRWLPELVAARTARWLGVLIGVVLWLTLLNELACYATNAPLL
jgi:succinate dehydrogenase / fumarate reductase, cytochrome b subunit